MKNILLIISVFIIVGSGYLFFKYSAVVSEFFLHNSNNETETVKIKNDSKQFIFKDEQFGFYLTLPQGYETESFQKELGTKTTVFTDEQKTDALIDFQIFITPYASSTISEQRLAKDIPSGVVQDPVEIRIGQKSSIPAMLFQSKDNQLGDTREVWFIHSGYLFEVTTALVYDQQLAEILDTLVFSADL